jgi:hypothetical protein
MNRRGRPFRSERENGVARKTRINEVMKALKDGTSDRADLAAKFNVSLSQINKDVAEAMQLIEKSMLDSAEKYRALQLARHEDYLESITEEYNAARNAAAPAATIALLANTGLKILDQENKMLGLYTQKFEVQQSTQLEFKLPVDQAAQMMALMEQQGLLPAARPSPPALEGQYREIPAEAPAETPS